jgi:hypothetical protein
MLWCNPCGNQSRTGQFIYRAILKISRTSIQKIFPFHKNQHCRNIMEIFQNGTDAQIYMYVDSMITIFPRFDSSFLFLSTINCRYNYFLFYGQTTWQNTQYSFIAFFVNFNSCSRLNSSLHKKVPFPWNVLKFI